MRWHLLSILLGIFFTSSACPIHAQERGESTTVEKLVKTSEDALRRELKAYSNAINERDFDSIASMLHPSVVYKDISLDISATGREAFLAQVKDALSQSDDVLTASIESIEMEGTTKATIRGVNGLGPADDTTPQFAFEVVAELEGDSWLIKSIVEEDLEPGPDSGPLGIDQIAWLEGTWQGSGGDKTVSQVRYLPGRKFMIRTFAKDGQNEGFQVIGFDNVEQSIRSWSYFADGSFGEATWKVDGEKSRIKSLQRLADGQLASGTYVLQQISEDELTVQLVGHEIGGQPMPNAPIVTARRVSQSTSQAGVVGSN
ncbi:MAG: nuclear transport factor 2 family protein [Planctomycetota bacterium]